MSLHFLEGKGTRTAVKLPEDNILLFWPVRAFSFLTPFQCGHYTLQIQGVLTLKRRKPFNLSICKERKAKCVTRGVYCSSTFEIKTPGFFWATSSLGYEALPLLFLCWADCSLHPAGLKQLKRGKVLVYYLIAADYPLVSLLSWTAAVLCFLPFATSSLTAKIQIMSMKWVLVVFKWTICISDLKKETCSCDPSCFQNTTPQGNQAIRQGYMWH